jgi:hypothetical protein
MLESERPARQKIEAELLRPFIEVVQRRGLAHSMGQGSKNQVPIRPRVYFQFGDLRVELPSSTLLIEVESSGGVTNLAKYWEIIETCRIEKPVRLLHVFRQKSINDYEAHLVIWRFLSEKMTQALGPRFSCALHVYRDGDPSSILPAVATFDEWLNDDGAVRLP